MDDFEKMYNLMRTDASIEACVNRFLEQNVCFMNGADVAKFHDVLKSHSQFTCRSELICVHDFLKSRISQEDVRPFNHSAGPDAQPS